MTLRKEGPKAYPGLWKFIQDLKIVDSHLHLFASPAEYSNGQKKSLLTKQEDVAGILKSLDANPFSREGWRLMCAHYLGTDQLTEQTLLDLGKIMNERYYTKGGILQMFDDAKIAFGVNDRCWMRLGTDYKMDRFTSKIRMDHFSQVTTFEHIQAIQKFTGSTIRSLDDMMEGAEKLIVQGIEDGATVIKNCLAYVRDLRFEKRTRHEAEGCLFKVINEKRFSGWEQYTRFPVEEMRPLHDFMVHWHCELAQKYGMTVNFHTGPVFHFSTGPRNLLELSNLFVMYPDVHFNLMHGNAPNFQDAAYMAKRYENVSIDLCWCHTFSPSYALEALHFWLGFAPVQSIVGYGTDTELLEFIWRDSQVARRTTYSALARHVDDGRITEEDAMETAKKILYDNPVRIFKLNG